MDTTMYDKLLRLPLFQGLSRNDLTEILEKIKVEFRQYDANEYITKQNRNCLELIYILDGRIKTSRKDDNNNFSLSEVIESNAIIEPYSLFGMHTVYTASYQAETETFALVIKKKYILSILCKYEIFNLNFLNILSNRSQNIQERLWNTHIGNTLDKIVYFLLLRCLQPYGPKELSIKMEDLANLIDETRINVSRALNSLQKDNLISLSRKCIKIFDLNDLYLKIKSN